MSTKPLVPTNNKIITGKVFIWSILIGYMFLEIFTIYVNIVYNTGSFFTMAVRIGIGAIFFYKMYNGSKIAKVIFIVLWSLSAVYGIYVLYEHRFLEISAKLPMILMVVYLLLSALVMTFSPAVRLFLSIQRDRDNLNLLKKSNLSENINWLWTWGGRFVGYIDGQYLWSNEGQPIGKISGRDIYNSDGQYIGEVMFNRLVTNISKKNIFQKPYICTESKPIYPKASDIVAYKLNSDYEDFPFVIS